MLKEGGTNSFEVALMWGHIRFRHKEVGRGRGGGGAISFHPFKGGH